MTENWLAMFCAALFFFIAGLLVGERITTRKLFQEYKAEEMNLKNDYIGYMAEIKRMTDKVVCVENKK